MENKQIQGLDVNGTKPTVAVPNSINDLNDGNTVLTKSGSSNKVYATDNSGNQTTLPYSQGISDGASIVQRDENGRITAQDPTNNTDVANKLYVDTVFDGSQKALAYADYDTMITAFNNFNDSAYKVGQNVYIRTLNVPDLWVYSVESTSVPYTYVDDATFIAGLTTDGYVQVGYYRLSQLETQTPSISNVKASDIDSESATSGQVLTANGSGGASWNSPSGGNYVSLDNTQQEFDDTKTLVLKSNKYFIIKSAPNSSWEGRIGKYTLSISGKTTKVGFIATDANLSTCTIYEVGWIDYRQTGTHHVFNIPTNRTSGTFATIEDIKDKVPDAPTTDGTYTLKVVVSSGVPTYQWVLDV